MNMNPDDITQLKVSIATILAQQTEANRRLEKIENNLEDKFVKKNDITAVIDRLSDLEENQKWVVRSIMAVVLAEVVAFLAFMAKTAHIP